MLCSGHWTMESCFFHAAPANALNLNSNRRNLKWLGLSFQHPCQSTWPTLYLSIYLYYLLKLMPSELRVNLLFISLTCRISMLRFFSDCARASHFSVDLQNEKSNVQSGALNPRLTSRKPAILPFCHSANNFFSVQ